MRKVFSISAMILSLVFLSGLHFFMYHSCVKPVNTNVSTIIQKNNAPIPVEERAPETANSSLAEEFTHDTSRALELVKINNMDLHRLHMAGKLQLIHFELVCPPPECRLINI